MAAFAKCASRSLRCLSNPIGAPIRNIALRRGPVLRTPRYYPASPILRHLQTRPFSQTSVNRARRRRPSANEIQDAIKLAKRAWSYPQVRLAVIFVVGGAVLFFYNNIETVPVTGRRRFNIYTPEKINELIGDQYKYILDDVERSGHGLLGESDPRYVMVKRVMDRLIPFSGMANADWQVWVIDDPDELNAFVLPGGKVFVYSGLLKVADNDDAVAAVLGHEIAHNVAQHTAERLSGELGIQALIYAGTGLLWLIGFDPSTLTGSLSQVAIDFVLKRPKSRAQETEADYIGLMMMAEACYDPEEAVNFWYRMGAELAARRQPPEWMSTHPSDNRRQENLRQWMPLAIDKKNQSTCMETFSFAEMFQRTLERQGGDDTWPGIR